MYFHIRLIFQSLGISPRYWNIHENCSSLKFAIEASLRIEDKILSSKEKKNLLGFEFEGIKFAPSFLTFYFRCFRFVSIDLASLQVNIL